MSDDTQYDVIVVGAGPGGALTGYFLSCRGLRTLIIEKKALPRHKPCGGGLTRRALDCLPFDVQEVIEDTPDTFIINVANRRVFHKTLNDPLLATVMRNKFDHFLIKKAVQAGAVLQERTDFRSLKGSAGKLEVVTSRGRLKTRIIVGADGVQSRVARALGLRVGMNVVNAMEGQVFHGEVDGLRNAERAVQFDFGIVPKGYGWVFPKRDHLSVGVFSTSRRIWNLKPQFSSYLKMKGLHLGTRITSLRSHLIPKGPPRRKDCFADERGLLVGDAAGFVDPLTGEGIFYAVRGAEIASEVIADAFSLGYGHMKQYNTLLKKAFANDLILARGIAYVLYNIPALGNKLLEIKGETLAEHQINVISGKGTYGELWRKVFRSPDLVE
jgi:geranylgeranyl reductase family protein